jgi:hypothetical protein
MKQQPDKLFHKKLGAYTRPAPVMAWNKIEAQLDKKNNRAIWLRVAAAVLILMISIPVVYTLTKEESPEISSTNNDIPPTTHREPLAGKSTVESTNPPEEKSQLQHESKIDGTDHKTDRKETPLKTMDLQQEVAVLESEVIPDEISDVLIDNPVVETENEIAYQELPTEKVDDVIDHSVKLVISAKETTHYFEGEENLLTPEATSKEKKTSTFRKLLRKASDLKTNQDPFGELRQKKNEILALNFKSDKKRSQKTN